MTGEFMTTFDIPGAPHRERERVCVCERDRERERESVCAREK